MFKMKNGKNVMIEEKVHEAIKEKSKITGLKIQAIVNNTLKKALTETESVKNE